MRTELIADERDEDGAVVFTRIPTLDDIEALLGPAEHELFAILRRASKLKSVEAAALLLNEIKAGSHPGKSALIALLEETAMEFERTAGSSRAA